MIGFADDLSPLPTEGRDPGRPEGLLLLFIIIYDFTAQVNE